MPVGPVVGIVGISMLALFAAYVWSIIWSYRDAKCRGKSGLLVVLLVACSVPIGFLAWLIFRPAQPVSAPDPSHEGRWKWILGLGGAAFIAAIFSGVVGIQRTVTHAIKETAAYIEAMDRLRNTPAAIEVLGAPIQDSIWISGSLNVNESSGGGEEAVIVPVSGPKGKLNLKATRSAGVWRLQSLILDADGKRIDLLRRRSCSPGDSALRRSAPSSSRHNLILSTARPPL
jgi:hypothetical protein